jgi:hypothetical protein
VVKTIETLATLADLGVLAVKKTDNHQPSLKHSPSRLRNLFRDSENHI